MWAFGISSFLMEGIVWVERHIDEKQGNGEDLMDQTMCKAARGIFRDLVQAARFLSTTLLPMILASFMGASFLVTATWFGTSADNCSVQQLSHLEVEGFTHFACRDGFVAVDMQVGVPAWEMDKSAPMKLERRLDEFILPSASGSASLEQKFTVGEATAHATHEEGLKPQPIGVTNGITNPLEAAVPHKGLKPLPVGATNSEQATTSLPFDCNADFTTSYKLLEGRWSVAKRSWCCTHAQRGCPTVAPNAPPGQANPSQTTVTTTLKDLAVSVRTVNRSSGNRFGFAAPIYTSLAAFEKGDAPVAWAVKGGSPVKRSVCDENRGMPGTCGLFAMKIQKRWQRFLVSPEWFGKSWGFNITHFSHNQMIEAALEVVRQNPHQNLTVPGVSPTFVVAEDVRQYFGIAYTLLWVVSALLVLGLLDRLVTLFDSKPSLAIADEIGAGL
jgi:hypothetical protein